MLVHCSGKFSDDCGTSLVNKGVRTAADHMKLRVVKTAEFAWFGRGIGLLGALNKFGAMKIPIIYEFARFGSVGIGFGTA